MFSPRNLLKRGFILSVKAFAIFGVMVTVAMVASIFIIMPEQSVSQSTANEATYRQLSLFGEVFQRVREEYVEEIEDSTLIDNAINGMLTALDPHSNFLAEEDFSAMRERTRGEFGGIGIQITMENGLVKVISPIEDTPAAQAGIESGDFIVRINREEVLGLTLIEAVERMRGPIGTSVSIDVKRGDAEPFSVTLTRDNIKRQSVRHESYGKVGYIRITNFSAQTTPGLEQSVAALKEEHGDDLEGVILDLRNNPGGLLSEAIAISDTFLDSGEIVSTRGRYAQDIARYYAKPGDIIEGIPMVVLINSGTASASEIVAGALKDHNRALVMGTRSFGKGSVQTIIPITNHGAIKLTTARYYTPEGISIQAMGIEPDIAVELAVVEDIEGGALREENLRGALDASEDNPDASENNNENNSNNLNELDRIVERINIQDYQLARAIDLLRGLKVFEQLAN